MKQITTDDVIEWGAAMHGSIKKYTFTSKNPKVPEKVEDIPLDMVGVTTNGKIAYCAPWTNGNVIELNTAIRSNSISMVGVFSDALIAVKASKKHFNVKKEVELKKLKGKKERLEKEIEKLEKELQ